MFYLIIMSVHDISTIFHTSKNPYKSTFIICKSKIKSISLIICIKTKAVCIYLLQDEVISIGWAYPSNF